MIELSTALVVKLALVAILPGVIAIVIVRIGTYASDE